MQKDLEPFITIATNGMQSDSYSSSSYSTAISSMTMPSPRTHDTRNSSYHLEDLVEFATQLDQAAQGVFPNRTCTKQRYDDVQVVLIRWEDDDRLGVSYELEDLGKVFGQGYGFQTTTWLIPREDPLENIMGKSLDILKNHGKEEKLIIIYYAGHGAMNEARQQIWLRNGRSNEGLLEWFAVQPLFLKAKADVLFLLDCCSAASAATVVSPDIIGTKETIAACGFESRAPEPGAHSFTSELIEVLDKWKARAPFSVAMLHSELLANLRHPKPKADMFGRVVESRRTPVYVVTTSRSKTMSIELAPRPSKSTDFNENQSAPKSNTTSSETPQVPSNEPGSNLSTDDDTDKYAEDQLDEQLPNGDLRIPHVLISLALDGEQLLDIKAWRRWLSDCPSFAKFARVEGLYKSHSTLLIISVPVVIWDLLPDTRACSFIGYVNSRNHLWELLQEEHDMTDLWQQVQESERKKGSPMNANPWEAMAIDMNLEFMSQTPASSSIGMVPSLIPDFGSFSYTEDTTSLASHGLNPLDEISTLLSEMKPDSDKKDDGVARNRKTPDPNNFKEGLIGGQPVDTNATPSVSSGDWSPTDDQTLIAARAQGMNWAPIQQAYFPSKTPNACRKRHERLMERRSADKWDGLALESLAMNYMAVRQQIWQGLAAATGEEWTVVEQKCMSQGLKNLQIGARAYARREKLLDGIPPTKDSTRTTAFSSIQENEGYTS